MLILMNLAVMMMMMMMMMQGMVIKAWITGPALPVAAWEGGEEKPEGEGVPKERAEEGEGGGDGCLQNPPPGAPGEAPRVL